MGIFLILLTAASILIVPPYAVARGFQSADSWNNKGADLYAAKKYQAAIQAFDQAIKLNPKSVSAYSNRGAAYDAMNHPERAVLDYTAAIKLRPGFLEAYNNRAYAYCDLGRFSDSIADLNYVLKREPRNAFAFSKRAFCYQSLGNLQQAFKDYEKATSINPKLATAVKGRDLMKRALNVNAGGTTSVAANSGSTGRPKTTPKPEADTVSAERNDPKQNHQKKNAAVASTAASAVKKPSAEQPQAMIPPAKTQLEDKVAKGASTANTARPATQAPNNQSEDNQTQETKETKATRQTQAQQQQATSPAGEQTNKSAMPAPQSEITKPQVASGLPGSTDTSGSSVTGAAAPNSTVTQTVPTLPKQSPVTPDAAVSNVVHHMIGNILFAIGQFDAAAGNFMEAERANPADAFAYYRAGNAFRAAGQLDKALTQYELALQLNPHFRQALARRDSLQRIGAAGLSPAAASNSTQPTDMNSSERNGSP